MKVWREIGEDPSGEVLKTYSSGSSPVDEDRNIGQQYELFVEIKLSKTLKSEKKLGN